MEAFVLDLKVADGACVCPSGNEDGSLGGLVPRGLVFELCIEGVDLGEEGGETDGASCFALQLQGALQADTDQQLEVVGQAGDQGQEFLCDAQAANTGALRLCEEGEEGNDFFAEQLGLTRVGQALWCLGNELGIEVVCGVEEQLDVDDEFLGGHDAVDIGAVADMQQHVGDACGRLLLKGGQGLPDPVDLCFNLLFLLSYVVADGVCGLAFCSVEALDDGLAGRVQAHIPVLVDHVAFRVPVLVLAIAVDFDKLLENGSLAAIAALGKLGGVVVVAVDAALVLVVAVGGAEDGGTDGAGEVLDVVFAV